MTEPTGKLAVCPFCGVEGKLAECASGAFYDSSFKPWEVVCQGCGISGPLEDTQAAAITAWNTRAQSADDTLIAELVEIIVVKAGALFSAYCAGLGLADDRRAYDVAALSRELANEARHRLAALQSAKNRRQS